MPLPKPYNTIQISVKNAKLFNIVLGDDSKSHLVVYKATGMLAEQKCSLISAFFYSAVRNAMFHQNRGGYPCKFPWKSAIIILTRLRQLTT